MLSSKREKKSKRKKAARTWEQPENEMRLIKWPILTCGPAGISGPCFLAAGRPKVREFAGGQWAEGPGARFFRGVGGAQSPFCPPAWPKMGPRGPSPGPHAARGEIFFNFFSFFGGKFGLGGCSRGWLGCARRKT